MTPDRQPFSVEEALAELSRQQASDDFTERVLEGLVERRPSKLAGVSPRWVATLGIVALVVLALGVSLRSHPVAEMTAEEERTQLLRQEYETLQDEVAALRSLAAQPLPILYLGGDSRIDLVLDLGQGDFDPERLDVRPATMDTRRAAPEGRRIQ